MIGVLVVLVVWVISMSVRTGINPEAGIWFDFSWIKNILTRSKRVKCEFCGDPATTWNCLGDGPKRVCKGCNDSINNHYGVDCDLHCMPELKERK